MKHLQLFAGLDALRRFLVEVSKQVLDLSRHIADDFPQLLNSGENLADFPLKPLVLC